MEYSIYTL